MKCLLFVGLLLVAGDTVLSRYMYICFQSSDPTCRNEL